MYQKFASTMKDLARNFTADFYSRALPEMTEFVDLMRSIDLESMTSEELVTHCNRILEHIRTVSYVNFVKTARLGFYYSQRLQDLLGIRLGMGRDQAEEMYSRLNQGLEGRDRK